jgi:peptidoglycan/LPS O-acetylase OafA/YrhL
VVGFHAFPDKIGGGFVGVDVFFVISGFLISTIMFGSLARGRFSFVEFYSRRIRRIVPSLTVTLAASLALGWFFLLPDEYRLLGKHVAGGASFTSNFVLWSESGYFDTAAETKPLLHLWSLGVEEQFYILYPFALWFAWRLGVGLFATTLVIALASFAMTVVGVGEDAVAAFYSPLTRLWELMLGAVLAYAAFRRAASTDLGAPVVAADVRSGIGFVLLGVGLVTITAATPFPGWWTLLPTFAAVFIISAGSRAWLNRAVLSSRVLVWFGLISFPLYLWHWLLLSFSRVLAGGMPAPEERMGAVLVAIMLAWATYRLVERPLRFGGRGGLKTAGLLVALASLGISGYLLHGHPAAQPQLQSRPQAVAVKAVAPAAEPPRPVRREAKPQESRAQIDYLRNDDAFGWMATEDRTEECIRFVGGQSFPYCMISQGRPITVALVGDSHANSLFRFFDLTLKDKGQGVVMLGKGGCPPFLGVERDKLDCPKLMRSITDVVGATPSIKTVYIAGRFAATLSGTNPGAEQKVDFYRLSVDGDSSITDRAQIFELGLASMLESLRRADKRVVVLLDYPELGFSPKECLEDRGGRECHVDSQWVAERQAPYVRIIERLQQRYRFKTVDMTRHFCRTGRCYASHEDHILYRDTHHLGINGNRYLYNKGARID